MRNDWTRGEVKEIFSLPLFELIFSAATVHRENHNPEKIKSSVLISVRTGACSEDCAYCAQSSRYKTSVNPEKLSSVKEIVDQAIEAKEKGVSRVCLSTSGTRVVPNKDFEMILEAGRQIRTLGLDVCCTMGMAKKEEIESLKNAGFSAYNHNIDTSERFYPSIITTRKFSERIETINAIIEGGMSVCSGGIIGMGETEDDRIDFLHTLATLPVHPFSVPLNMLVPVSGTPLESYKPISSFEMVRMIACARILMPQSNICLAAGRSTLSNEAQALCYLAGANSIFGGDKLLTTPNMGDELDNRLFELLNLKKV
ncbi:MAG: biotin synthase BioB [Bacteroidota bacterium]